MNSKNSKNSIDKHKTMCNNINIKLKGGKIYGMDNGKNFYC